MHTRLIRFRHNTNQVSLAAAGLPHQEAKEKQMEQQFNELLEQPKQEACGEEA